MIFQCTCLKIEGRPCIISSFHPFDQGSDPGHAKFFHSRFVLLDLESVISKNKKILPLMSEAQKLGC